ASEQSLPKFCLDPYRLPDTGSSQGFPGTVARLHRASDSLVKYHARLRDPELGRTHSYHEAGTTCLAGSGHGPIPDRPRPRYQFLAYPEALSLAPRFGASARTRGVDSSCNAPV